MTSRAGKPDTEADVQVRTILDSVDRKGFVVISGAGSGKTTSIVKALDHLRKSKARTLRQRGQKVACITYTEVAVKEIWGDVGNDTLFHVSTIHSFLWAAIKPFQADIRNWVRCRIEQRLATLRDEAAGFSNRVRQNTRDRNLADQERYARYLDDLNGVSRFVYGTGSDYGSGVLGHEDVIALSTELLCSKELIRRVVGQQFPFVFVDESQDTDPRVVQALKAVSSTLGAKFCIGFIGDPMQKIYATGIGDIPLEPGWQRVEKPENFRCPQSVLQVINQIRAEGDGLQQTGGRRIVVDGQEQLLQGSAHLFIAEADHRRIQRMSEVRCWLAGKTGDEQWLSDDRASDVKLLVIAHRMAATRLGFGELFSALNDGTSESLKDGFREGTLWLVEPFLKVLLPTAIARSSGDEFQVISLLRKFAPALERERVSEKKLASVLKSLREALVRLDGMLRDETATMGEVLTFAREVGLVPVHEKLEAAISAFERGETMAGQDGEAIAAAMRLPVAQLWGYRTYIEEESLFDTQQGVKGAEFERVLTVLDDEEGRHNQFSYGKYLGAVPLSETDERNIAEGKDSTLDRTRRLFYVCCSRAARDLAVLFFCADADAAVEIVKRRGLFPPDRIHRMQ